MSELDKSIRNRDTLEGLEAYLDSLEGNANAALEKIASKTDPESVRRRLAILIDNNRLEDAAREALAHKKSQEWVDLAVFALAAIGNGVTAKEYVDWAKDIAKLAFWKRSAIGHYDGTLSWIQRNRANHSRIIPGSLSPAERDQLQRTAVIVEAACASTFADGRAETELDVQLFARLFDVSYVLVAPEKCREIVRILEKRNPIPLLVAQAIMKEIVEPTNNIVDRLWSEHGEVFQARFLACVIHGRMSSHREIAIDRAYELIALAKSHDDKEDLCQLLYELANPDDHAALAKVKQAATGLLGEDAHFLRIIEANELLRQEKAVAALAAVETTDLRDDPQAKRIKAFALLQSGKSLEALTLLQELTAVAPTPRLFKTISDIAREQNRENDEQGALERVLALVPSEHSARRRLAWLYAKRGDYKQAIPHFEFLHRHYPSDVSVTVNLAVSYSFAGQHDRAMAVLATATPDTGVPFPIVKTRAQLLHANGRSLDAFHLLDAVRDTFWEEPQFLTLYMTVSHAVDREAQAHEALVQLLGLKQKGLVDDSLIRATSLDEMVDWISSAAKRHSTVSQYMVEGKLPWIMSAAMEHEALYWAWTLRTQPMPWLVDSAINRASYSIYATNSFRVLHKPNDSPILTDITCAAPRQTIVADASALITLHSLGVLEKAADYFGTVLVPASYLPKIIADGMQLFPHQLSQKKSAERIKAAVDQRSIAIQDAEVASQQAARLDEYEDEKDVSIPLYRLQDLLDTLHTKGLITDAQRDRAQSVAHKESTTSQRHSPLQLGDCICIAESTLATLIELGWLDIVTRKFSVSITQKDLAIVTSRIRAFRALDTARSQHKNLWDSVQANSRFEFVPVTEALAVSDDEEPDRGIATAAYLVAKDKHVPLLVDDRVCQGLLLNERKDEPIAAFGTDLLVQDMAKVGTITGEQAADALLQLMAWRYRFIVVPPEILKSLADRYRSHAPGADLRQIALYVHDCMRDEGLFGGLETTEPPSSIAIRLYQRWVQNVAEFIIDVWLDETFDEDNARNVTAWALTELLPSPPYVADERQQATLAALTPRTAISQALLRSINGHNVERVNKALQEMKAAFELNETEYFKIIVGVVSGI